ncbi:MAG: hypothetical protein QNJ46_27320 [Leptolyngbyaceae cyanobacterium MO_188.B28]|nr:hypothetical protein [Leptolyngbyaceae cyanobacterium MO_188.B28]
MYIIIEHEIGNSTFWESIQKTEIPSNLKLRQSLPNVEGTKAVCLWEADTLDEVRKFVEATVGEVSNNAYFAVDAESALGLPA